MSNSHEMSYRQVAAPLAGMVADAGRIRPTLLVAAGIFLLVAGGLVLTPFRSARAPV
jgi:hypothetical protein